MKITKINVEAKKSWNYQTYTSGMEVEIEEGDNVDEIRRAVMLKCRTHAMELIKEDRTFKKE